jgi:hypothetical protein
MKQCQLWGFLMICTAVVFTGCKDDDSKSGSAASEASCNTVCEKAVSCGEFTSNSECVAECTTYYSASEIGCVNNCDKSADCAIWYDCGEACFPVVQGNGEYCPGYVMGSDDDDCCQTNNPCDWSNDHECDCGGSCTWDNADCSQ